MNEAQAKRWNEAREKISLIVIRKLMALLMQDKELFEEDCKSLGLTPTGFSNNVADAILAIDGLEIRDPDQGNYRIFRKGIKAANLVRVIPEEVKNDNARPRNSKEIR